MICEALKAKRADERKDISISSYYLQLVGFEFYQNYLEHFHAVLAEQEAEEGSLRLDDLPVNSISKDQFHQVIKNGYKGSLTSRTCPKIFLMVTAYLHKRLSYGGNTPVLFRDLTLPIAIEKLAPYLSN